MVRLPDCVLLSPPDLLDQVADAGVVLVYVVQFDVVGWRRTSKDCGEGWEERVHARLRGWANTC